MPSTTAGASALSLGSTGVLTDPSNDSREWVWAHLYDDGALEVTASGTPDASRTLLASGTVCANAVYLSNMGMPWYDSRTSLLTCEFPSDVATVSAWHLDYWFYSNAALTGVTG